MPRELSSGIASGFIDDQAKARSLAALWAKADPWGAGVLIRGFYGELGPMMRLQASRKLT